jgi:hypothetical protein
VHYTTYETVTALLTDAEKWPVSAYLNKPWLQFVIYNDVIAIALETMPIIGHNRRHSLQ